MLRIEFYGIPRERAGVAQTTASGATLGEVLTELAACFPQFAADCVDAGGNLRPQFIANIGGQRFIREPATPLREGDSLLILSADSGG